MFGAAAPVPYNSGMKNGNDHLSLPTGVKTALEKRLAQPGHFHNHLGIVLEDARTGWARLSMDITPELINVLGIVHGGAIFSLVDTAMGTALIGLLAEEEGMATVEAKINYVSPVREGTVTAEAEVKHRGRRTAVIESRVTDGSGRAVAVALGTYLILEPGR